MNAIIYDGYVPKDYGGNIPPVLPDLASRLNWLFKHRVDEAKGAHAKISSPTISRYRRGLTDPRSKDLDFLARQFEVNLNWLISGHGHPWLDWSDAPPPADEGPSNGLKSVK